MTLEAGLEFKPYGIGHLLSEHYFAVPYHQRSYKWEKEDHVRRLLDDVNDAINEQQSSTYFLGTIVLKRGDNPTDRFEVIDGQQRLATVLMFLAAVRDYFKENSDKERAVDLQRKYLSERDLRSRSDEPHLLLNFEDKEFFRDRVVLGEGGKIAFRRGDSPPPSHRKIADAMNECRQRVDNIAALGSPTTASDRLLNWIDFFHHRATVVAIFAAAEQNAYTLFETLNDRGLELTKADLIKNHLFGRAQSELEHVRGHWTAMTATLESAGEEEITVDYIRHYWMSKNGPVRKKALYKVVKEQTHAKRDACTFTSEISRDAKQYAALLNPEADLWKKYGDTTKDHVTALRRMGIEVIRPLALSVLRKFDVPNVRTAFHLFVNWSVRFLIVGGHRGEGLETAYSECAVEIDKDKIRTAAQMAKKMLATVPSDDTFKSAFSTARVSRPILARYYLRAIEDHKAGEKHPEKITDPKNDSLTLEHVLPINPSSDWDVSDIDTGSIYNRLGNLALLPKAINEDIGNSGFEDKKAAFARSALEFTKWISRQSQWGLAEVEKRQRKLAEIAVDTWPLKLPKR